MFALLDAPGSWISRTWNTRNNSNFGDSDPTLDATLVITMIWDEETGLFIAQAAGGSAAGELCRVGAAARSWCEGTHSALHESPPGDEISGAGRLVWGLSAHPWAQPGLPRRRPAAAADHQPHRILHRCAPTASQSVDSLLSWITRLHDRSTCTIARQSTNSTSQCARRLPAAEQPWQMHHLACDAVHLHALRLLFLTVLVTSSEPARQCVDSQ